MADVSDCPVCRAMQRPVESDPDQRPYMLTWKDGWPARAYHRHEGPRCHDCNVWPGTPHIDGCDTARCTECGWQRISCEHADSDIGWGATWTGKWPGQQEVDEGLADDLNDLALKAALGLVRWDKRRERFIA